MLEIGVSERSSADVRRTVTELLADLRAHRIDGPDAVAIREAADQDETEGWSWVGAISLVAACIAGLTLWIA